MSEVRDGGEDGRSKTDADAAIQAAVDAGLIDPETRLDTLLKLGAGTDVSTLGYVVAWDRYAVVVK